MEDALCALRFFFFFSSSLFCTAQRSTWQVSPSSLGLSSRKQRPIPSSQCTYVTYPPSISHPPSTPPLHSAIPPLGIAIPPHQQPLTLSPPQPIGERTHTTSVPARQVLIPTPLGSAAAAPHGYTFPIAAHRSASSVTARRIKT